jgi:Domain of unknown function (DUF4034)
MTRSNVSSLRVLKRYFRSLAGLVIGITVFAIASSHPVFAADANGTAPPCGFSDAAFNPATDIKALDDYHDAIAQMLKEKKFAQLDCLADSARATKARFSGGYWKLRNIYVGLELPRPGHPTQEDWRRHFELIRSWVERNPRSITARIALAESYVNYAWDARGDGYTDSVSDSGWKLFSERSEKAKEILDHASALRAKCPEWFLAMQRVGRGLAWDLPRLTAAFEQAARFEPDYQNYYSFYAVDLLPKWSGNEGDAARFGEQVANKIGGDDGDILYYQIASETVCGCHDRDSTYFSWPRVQKGYAALEKKYGLSLLALNHFAALASDFNDSIAAKEAFERIGNNWAEEVWHDEESFKSSQEIAVQNAAVQTAFLAIRQEAEANMHGPEWESYRKGFEEKLAALEQSCKDAPKSENEASDDSTPFDLMISIGKEGTVEKARGLNLPSSAQCLVKALYESHIKNEKTFPAPPRAPYSVVAHVDPSKIDTAMK